MLPFLTQLPATARCRNLRRASSSTGPLRVSNIFFSALFTLGRVRDQARAKALAERYPDGVYRDGRRIVVIDAAA